MIRKPVRSGFTAVLVVCLLASAFLLDLSINSLGNPGVRQTTTTATRVSSPSSSSNAPPTKSYGGLRVNVVTLNDSSSEVTSQLPITIRRNEVVTDDRLLVYAAQGGPLEVELPANAYYLIVVQVPLFPVSVRVRVLGNELTVIKIWINQVSRRISSFEMKDTDSTGNLADWGNIFVRTDKIVTPQSDWNRTMLLLKSGLLPAAPYSDARLVQSEQVDVAIVGTQEAGGSSIYLQLRSASALQTTGISSLSFLGFASGYQVSYSTGWTNSQNILRELVQDGPTGGG